MSLATLLKHKGIGPQGSKNLDPHEVDELEDIIFESKPNLITLATMLVALVMLPANEDEAILIDRIRQEYKNVIPKSLHFLFTQKGEGLLTYILKSVGHHDLTEVEATEAIGFYFSAEPVYQAMFLEAQRLKRETFTENAAFFKEFLKRGKSSKVSQPEVLLLCDSYDGCVRINPFTVFVCPILAALGLPTYMTGIEDVAPKKGVTAYQLLQAVNKTPTRSLANAKNEIETIGWTYVDQSVSFPELYAQREMREKMVKRPFLATFEKMMPVLQGGQNYCFTSYTHKAYRKQVVELLIECTDFDKVANSKGVEATTRPKLNLPTEVMWYSGEEIEEKTISLSGNDSKATFSIPEMMQKGIEVLSGTENEVYDVIVSHAALCLHLFRDIELDIAYANVKEVLDNGKALKVWEQKG